MPLLVVTIVSLAAVVALAVVQKQLRPRPVLRIHHLCQRPQVDAAAVLRACAVFLIAAHVASSTLREMNDKGLELMLALPLPRATQYLGRLAGFAALGIFLAAAFSAPLLLCHSGSFRKGSSCANDSSGISAASLCQFTHGNFSSFMLSAPFT